MQDEVHYCGYIINKRGIHKSPSKVKAIWDTPRATTVWEVKAFMGLVYYYGRFVADLSIVAYPSTELLRRGRKLIWSPG